MIVHKVLYECVKRLAFNPIFLAVATMGWTRWALAASPWWWAALLWTVAAWFAVFTWIEYKTAKWHYENPNPYDQQRRR